MKKSSPLAFLIALIAFFGAVAATLYYLKKKGIIFINEEYEFEDSVNQGFDNIEDATKDLEKKARYSADDPEYADDGEAAEDGSEDAIPF